MMSPFEKWFIQRVLRKEVTQGAHHAVAIETIYKMVREAAVDEFYEDNSLTIDAYLRERFESTQSESSIK